MVTAQLQKLESLEDIGMLVRGDRISVKYVPFKKDAREVSAEEVAVHTAGRELFEFVMPHPSDPKVIRGYTARKSKIDFDGVLCLHEGCAVISNYDKRDLRYDDLSLTLNIAGFGR